MKKWKCRVERHQVWNNIIVEADTEEEARSIADEEACNSDVAGCDDHAYDTTAKLISDDE